MPIYELRLYKQLQIEKLLHRVVDFYGLEAADDQEAKNLACSTQTPSFDDSDYAILYGPSGVQLWRIDR